MKRFPLLLLILLLSTASFSQSVFLRTGTIRPKQNITARAVDSFARAAPRFAGKAFAVLQFTTLPAAAELRELKANGIELLNYLPQNAYTVAITGHPPASLLQKLKASALFPLLPRQKMQAIFARGQIPAWAVKVPGTVDVWLSFYPTLDTAQVLQQLKTLGVEVLSTKHLAYRIIALRIAPTRMEELAAQPFVEYLQPAPPGDQPLNYNSRAASGASLLNAAGAAGGYALNGEGITIGHGDNADLQDHADLFGRVINRNASPFAPHGLHTAGTIAGAGNINELYRGYAPRATLVSQAFSLILDNAATYVQDYGMVITSNSYGNIISCEYDGTYDLTSRILDQQALDLPHLIQVFAAGNSGESTCAPYPNSYHTVLGGYQSAKNVLTVGATNDVGQIASFSSRGPVKDGRLKPEITAMGQQVISTWPGNTYSYNNGTSMAAPAVSGGLALLYQRYRQLHSGANPPNALMKALLCNGALDRGTAGPDFDYGFGGMNLLRSVNMLDQNHYFNSNSLPAGTTEHSIVVPAATAQLNVLLYWNDLPASIISDKTLVNDLDLEVIDPLGHVVLPKILDTALAALGQTATTGADHVNNIEQVVISTPVAGTYTLRVRGTTVTNGQQAYSVAYDPVPVHLTITAPAGNMKLVPGESTKITWENYGLSGTATLEFLPYEGASWSTLASDINLNSLSYTWTVPTVVTQGARIRLKNEGTGETFTSAPFTVLGQPVVSLAPVQCEGYIALNWTAVPNATDYEVMRLQGTEMQRVALTTATTYTLSGLKKDSTYFVTVRARISDTPGRRAVAIWRQPNSGSCAGSLSDNDLQLDAILSPQTGRKGTATERKAAEMIQVQIKNLDDAPVSDFTVSYTVNGGTPVSESVSASIAAGATYTHVFSVPANLSAPGSYTLTTVVKKLGDANAANDTATRVVRQLENPPLTLATLFVDNFETAAPASYESDTTGLAGDERFDFSRTTAYGRLRTELNTGLPYSGSRALTLDASRFAPDGNTNFLYGTFNLENFQATTNDLRLDFRYLNQGQIPNPANRVWVRGSDTKPWIEVFNLDAFSGDVGVYKKIRGIELSRLLLANGQNFSSSFQVRWGQWGVWPATSKEYAGGYTLDDLRLYAVQNDVELVSIESPAAFSCGLSAATSIQVLVRNNSGSALMNVPVRYRVNKGSYSSETIASLPAYTTVAYTFATPANLGSLGEYHLEALVDLNSDSFHENDTATATIYHQPVVTQFPYLQNFENGSGYFYPAGQHSSWEFGTPNSRKIRGAASGANAWKTGLQGTYNDREFSYLYSPCFDLTGMTAPTLSFSLALDLEDCGSGVCDAAWVEYSEDGLTWMKLGTAGSGTNWYNKGDWDNVWSVQDYTRWHVATQALPTGVSRLRLRFVLSSDPAVAKEGIALDDIHIYDNVAGIYTGPSLTTPLTQPVAGNTWVNFTADGQLVASIQPRQQSLGTTSVQAYVHPGPVRFTNNQYYHHRNITIQPASNPTGPVQVRLYFLDSETESLLSANGCSTCPKPASAYELGISQFSSFEKITENGSVADNQSGLWQFIPQVAIVPFDKGYYAEFEASRFSEFWLSSGSLGNPSPLPVKLVDFSARRQGSLVLLSWKVAGETSVVRYEVEAAPDTDALQAGRFIRLGEVAASNPASGLYSFTDAGPAKAGVWYYRLRVVNSDGSSQYSSVQPVLFSEAVQWVLYPNPGSGNFNLVYQLPAGEVLQARLYDTRGQLMKEYRTGATGFPQKLNIDISANNYASGVYLLRLQCGSNKEVLKLYKR